MPEADFTVWSRESLERFSLANTAQAYTQVYDRLISGR